MKKILITLFLGIILSAAGIAQPVSDRAVIPIGVTFQQILRIHVINGGNIEFVFNDISDYATGIQNGATGFYDTDVVVASSTDWQLHFGAEDATLLGTDNPLNTLALNNVGFTLAWTGSNLCCFPGDDIVMGAAYLDADATPNGLKQFTGGAADLLLTDGATPTGSGGDATQNAFVILWECGTLAAGSASSPMNAVSILAQSPAPDRYVTNVFLDLEAL